MVEVPAAVAMADQLAAEVNFFSIGTNDLSQYVIASDRTNPKVATLADAFEPAVARLRRKEAEAIAHAVLQLDSAEAVRDYIAQEAGR